MKRRKNEFSERRNENKEVVKMRRCSKKNNLFNYFVVVSKKNVILQILFYQQLYINKYGQYTNS